MIKEKQRKSILVSEACFTNFNEVRNKLNKNSSDTLTELMNAELIHSETTIISRNKMNNRLESSGDFDHETNKLSKKVGEKFE
jgi:hypothetical protein